MLIARTVSSRNMVVDIVPPFDIEFELFASSQWLGQIDAHHGSVDMIRQRLPFTVVYMYNMEPTFKRFVYKMACKFFRSVISFCSIPIDIRSFRILGSFVLIQLYP